MRITGIRLRDVKRHEELDIELAAGLTVIQGPNEAGKSTIQRAIEMALFRRPTSTAQEMDSVRSWTRPDAAPTVELTFETDDAAGRLVKIFGGTRGTSRLELDGDVITDPAAVDARLAELSGIPSEKFFRSTACIRHQELVDLDREEGVLRDRLQQSISGADRGTHAARRKLKDAIARVRAEGAKNPGPLKQTRDEIARLTDEAVRGEQGLAALERDRTALATARAAREALDLRLAQAQTDLEAAERALSARGRLARAEADYAKFRRAAELREEIARREASHPSTIELPVLQSGVERLRAMEFEIIERRAEIATQGDPSSWEATAQPAPRWLPWLLVAPALAVAAIGAGLVLPQPVGLVVAVVALALAAIAALWGLRLRSRASQVQLQNEMLETDIARRRRGRSDLEEGLHALVLDRDGQLATLGLVDLERAEALLATESAHVAGIVELRAEYRGLLGETPEEFEDVAQLRDRRAAEADEARHTLAGMGPVGTDPEGHKRRAEGALAQIRAERDGAVREEAAAREGVARNTTDAEEVAAVRERLDLLAERLSFLERRLRVYELALSSLDAAEVATMKRAARFLEQRMGADVEAITGGRYRRVTVDEEELRFRVFSPESGDWQDVTTLSRGTLDQIYLAARLGLVRQVTGDRRPPLIFDDPFVTFDDDRARRAVELLKRLAADHQVIYLTCSERYAEVADRVIRLHAPTEVDTPADAVAAGDGGHASNGHLDGADLHDDALVPVAGSVADPVRG